MKLHCGLVLLASALASPANAQPTISDGNGFLLYCENPKTEEEKLSCRTYTRGVIDAFVLVEKYACGPPEATYSQRHAILLKYVQDNPRERHLFTPWLYLLSQWAAFNCLAPLPPP